MTKPTQRHYLAVPYAQKDEAKALGARWDAAQKKWYVPAGVDIALFERWKLAEQPEQPTRTTAAASKSARSGSEPVVLAVIQPQDQNFVAYSGEEPPWD